MDSISRRRYIFRCEFPESTRRFWSLNLNLDVEARRGNLSARPATPPWTSRHNLCTVIDSSRIESQGRAFLIFNDLPCRPLSHPCSFGQLFLYSPDNSQQLASSVPCLARALLASSLIVTVVASAGTMDDSTVYGFIFKSLFFQIFFCLCLIRFFRTLSIANLIFTR